MSSDRNLAIRLNAGEAEDLNLGELHLIVVSHNPYNGSRELFRTITLHAPSEVAHGSARTVQNVRALLIEALQAIDNAKGN